ncbi:ubiquinol-cytochrome c reductase iron-sulfur subunit [Mucilaginibacter sp. BT774]|uniref:QcrA and Rieske domain-containing protein n=1 Tax=Mucilaginibacter sp. BT774 TaxID=3062276 RepID=UPI002674F8B5|nr:Rieske 2Fe-2S domain-containing protein [Mucilaginibacter sp. BT774]MDO3626338.1 Rieske 2Fe-2S domain-containing protein [Mucilaginibacter sp. BT774]
MDRRSFVKQSCTMCLAVGAGLVAASALSSCATLPVYKTTIGNNKVSVPVSLFAQSDFLVIQPKDMLYNIGLRKEKDGSYAALLLRCTHADNQLVATGNGFRCNLHGSSFDKQGQVTQGPAERSLKKYPTEIIADQIIIHLS